MSDPTVIVAPRPRLMFYCQHSVGLGHLVRSLTVAGGLAEAFDVVLLSGGPLPEALAAPPGVELIGLPPLGYSSDFGLVSRDPQWSVEQACQLRTWRILDEFRARQPDVLLIELFPFGRRKFGFELLPLLAEAQTAVPRPLVATSLRDILVGRRGEQRGHDQRACDLANRHLDAVLVHSDPTFARLEDSFAPGTPLTVPVCYTGFVRAGERQPEHRPQPPAPRVLVSAGGGMVGEPLFRAAVAAAPALLRHERLTTSIVAGPFLPEPAWTELQQAARQQPGLEVRRYVPDLAAEMADSAATVSQGGYNTTMDVLACGTPALVVPYADRGEDEQLVRARRLEQMGALRVLEAAALDGSTLAAAVRGLLRQRPPVLDLDLDGRAHTVRVVAELAGVAPKWTNGAGGSGTQAAGAFR
jgi:predicted glycosyltransferase